MNISPFYEKERVKEIGGAGRLLFVMLSGIIVVSFLSEYIFARSVDLAILLPQSIYFFVLAMVVYWRISSYLKIEKGVFNALDYKIGDTKIETRDLIELRDAITNFYQNNETNQDAVSYPEKELNT